MAKKLASWSSLSARATAIETGAIGTASFGPWVRSARDGVGDLGRLAVVQRVVAPHDA